LTRWNDDLGSSKRERERQPDLHDPLAAALGFEVQRCGPPSASTRTGATSRCRGASMGNAATPARITSLAKRISSGSIAYSRVT
jgi:hypothetical protein